MAWEMFSSLLLCTLSIILNIFQNRKVSKLRKKNKELRCENEKLKFSGYEADKYERLYNKLYHDFEGLKEEYARLYMTSSSEPEPKKIKKLLERIAYYENKEKGKNK